MQENTDQKTSEYGYFTEVVTFEFSFKSFLPCQFATINIDGSVIKSSNSHRLLGVIIDSNLIFEEHIVFVENYMHCAKYHNVYHQIRSVLNSPSQFNHCLDVP